MPYQQFPVFEESGQDQKWSLSPPVPQGLKRTPPGEFDFTDTIKAVIGGVVEGFTTIKLFEEPDNEYERIIKNISHLVGFAPGILANPLSKVGALTKIGAISGLGKSLRGAKGIPLWIGHKAATGARKIVGSAVKGATKGRADAFATTSKFLSKDKGFGYQISKMAPEVAEGAMSLGLASSISSWQGGVDAMVQGFAGGAIAGGVFKSIGNVISKEGIIRLSDPKMEKWARALSGSIFMGLPAQQRGATTPEVIYEYLAGAYFGGSEVPWTQAKAGKFVGKMSKKAQTSEVIKQTMDPKIYDAKAFEKLEPEVQTEVYKMTEAMTKGTAEEHHYAMWDLAERTGFLEKIPKNADVAEAVAKNYGNFRNKAKNEKLKELQGQDYEAAMGKVRYVMTGGGTAAEKLVEKAALAKGRNIVRMEGRDEKVTDDRSKQIFKIPIEDKEYTESNEKVFKAAADIDMTKNLAKYSEYQLNLLRRDWAKVKNTNSVIVLSQLDPSMTKISDKRARSGIVGTQMAINEKKPVYIFSDNPVISRRGKGDFKWYSYNSKMGMFEAMKTIPNIKENITVFGKYTDKEITNYEVDAIANLFEVADKKGVVHTDGLSVTEKEDILDAESLSADIGTTTASSRFDRKMEGILHRYIGPELKKTDPKYEDVLTLNNKVTQYAQKMSELLEPYLEKGKINGVGLRKTKVKGREVTEEWADEVERELDIHVDAEMRGKMRQYLKVQNQGEPVQFINSNGTKTVLADPKRPYTMGGKSVLLIEPRRIYHDIYKQAGGVIDKTPTYAVLDNININGKDIQVNRVVPTLTMQEYIRGKKTGEPIKWKDAEVVALNEYRKYITNITKSMDKYNLYPMEGVGDSGKIVFQKFHPKESQIDISSIKKSENYKLLRHSPNGDKMMRSNIAYVLDYNGLEYNAKNVEMLTKTNFLKNAFDHNKRSQIINTPMWKVDKEYINSRIDLTKTNGNFGYIIVKDPKKPPNFLKASHTDTIQGVDGGIHVLPEAINVLNFEGGHVQVQGKQAITPGFNKSFIISKPTKADLKIDPQLGAMLGKYGMHIMPPKMAIAVRKYNKTADKPIQMIVHESAAKQSGNRKMGSYEHNLKGRKNEISFKGTETYELNPNDIMQSQSVFDHNSMLGFDHSGRYQGTKVAKQFLTNLHTDAFTKIPQEVIDNIYGELVQKAYDGVPKHNGKVTEYLKTQDPNLINEIMYNFRKLGVEQVQTVLKTPGAERLAQRMMSEIIKVNRENIESLVASGEITNKEGHDALGSLTDFNSAAENIYKNALAVAKRHKANMYSVFFDKSTRKYTNQSLRNWIVDTIATPRIENSGQARMRINTQEYDKMFPELNDDKLAQKRYGLNSDEIFYLGENHRDMPIYTTIPRYAKTTLGELWNNRHIIGKNSPKLKKQLDEVFRAVVLRVPMDSLSGAQVLHFKGFTNTKDHGILQHGRSMEKQGGADNDADESFVYFGGKSENNIGFGMKESWKDAIRTQTNEFVSGEKLPEIPIKYVKSIKSGVSDRFVSAQTDKKNKQIKIDKVKLREDFDNKVWTKPKVKGVDPLPEDAFKTYEQWEEFVINHEKAHFTSENMKIKDLAARENHANKLALGLERDFLPGKTHEDKILISRSGDDSRIIKLTEDPALKFAPKTRLFAAERAATNRDQLGPSITLTNDFRSGWSSIANNKGYEIADSGYHANTDYRFIVEAKTSEAEKQYQKEITRDVTAFAADPYHRGTIGRQGIKELLFDSYFNWKYQEFDQASNNWKTKEFRDTSASKYMKKTVEFSAKKKWEKKGRVQLIQDINNALYGRNWVEGRKNTLTEIREKLNQGEWTQEERNTFMPKIAKTLENYTADVSVFHRINKSGIENVYELYNLKAKDPKYQKLKNTMFRTYFGAPYTDFVKFVVQKKFWHMNKAGKLVELDKYIEKNNTDTLAKDYENFKEFGEKIEFDPSGKHAELMTRFGGDAVKAVKELYKQEWIKGVELANDFVSQDVDVMATFDRILALKADKMDPKLVSSIAEHTDLIKVANYINYKSRNKGYELEQPTDVEFLEALDKAGNLLLNQKQKKVSNSLLDQNAIDKAIAKFKHTLPNDQAKDLYDTLLLGSLRTTNAAKKLPALLKQVHKSKNKVMKRVLKELYRDGSKTSTTQIAYNSYAVNSSNIQKFLVAKNKYFRKMEQKIDNTQRKEIKEFDKEADILSTEMAQRTQNVYIDAITGYEGLKKGKLNPEQSKIVAELANNLKQEADFVGKDLNQVLAGIHYSISGTPKDMKNMNIADLATINRWFKHVKNGNWLQKLQKALKGRMEKGITGFDYMSFPENVAKKMMAHDIKFLPRQGFFLEKTGGFSGMEKQMMVPTQYGEVLVDYIGRFQSSSDGLSKDLLTKFDDKFRYLTGIDPVGGTSDRLYRLSVRFHEAKGQGNAGDGIYQKNLEQSKINNNWETLKNEKHPVMQPDGKKISMTGREIVNKTMKTLDKFTNELHTFIVGEEGALDKYKIGFFDPGKDTQPILDADLFIRDVESLYQKGELLFNHDIGIDGARHMTRSVMYHILPTVKWINKNTNRSISVQTYNKLDNKMKKFYKADKGKKGRQLANLVINKTNKQKGYYPHMFFEISRIKKMRDIEVQKVEEMTNLPSEEKVQAMKQVMTKFKTMTGDWDFADYEVWQAQDRFLYETAIDELGIRGKQKEEKLDLDGPNKRFGNMMGREFHMDGWDVGPSGIESYVQKLSNTFYRQMSNMMSRVIIDKMNKNNYKTMVKNKDDIEGKKLVNSWSNFWTLYAREAVGNPVIISDALYNDPAMKLNTNPYGWWADNRIANNVNRIAKFLGIGKKYEDLPEGLKPVDAHTIKRWSNTEGKYQLATLMTHPKTMINNVFGGTMHTFMSVGSDIMRKTRDYKYLQTIDPTLKTRQDVYNKMDKLGITPEQTRYEWGLDKEVRTNAKAQSFMKDLTSRMRTGEGITDLGLRETAQKHGITKKVMDYAAKFMSIPEQWLRADAFMAHYIKAYERFGGAITDPNHPILIEAAKKGVKATQFLYNAPYRPGFSRTGLGKIMTRFQLWSWNAVRFRNDVYKKAKIYGFEPGSESFEKLKRTMSVDMITYALSGAFMYSMFNNVLPAPYSWLQDTSEWLLGDEKERDQAFYGQWPTAIAPLQIITPPIARFPMSIIREFADDDYTRLSDYYIYTAFPFGRMLRDVSPLRENSLINNPGRFPETLAGIPRYDIGKKRKEIKESDYEPPRLGR